MRIKTYTFQMGNDFSADLECEHCCHVQRLNSGYHDGHYHNRVLPAITCQSCGKSRDGDDSRPNPNGRAPGAGVTVPRLTRHELALLDEVAAMCERHDCYGLSWFRGGTSGNPAWRLQGYAVVESPDRAAGDIGYVSFPDYTYCGELAAGVRERIEAAAAAAMKGGE